LPNRVSQTVSQFFADFFQNGLFASQWLFWLFMASALVLLSARGRFWRKESARTPPGIAVVTATLGLALAWVVTMAAIYWHDVMSFRYLLNWVVVPAWLLALGLCLQPNLRRWTTHLAAVAGMLGITLSLGKLETEKMVFPRPAGAQVLRDYCLKNNLSEGLADYWSEYYLRVVWDFAGPRLSQIREKDFTYFWCSNAFDNFPPAPDGRGLRLSAPQFVVLNGLDRAQIATWLGGGPLRSEMVGPYEIARLTPEQMSRAAVLVTDQSKEILAGPRAHWLETQLPPHS
jgi:hypothetical protein